MFLINIDKQVEWYDRYSKQALHAVLGLTNRHWDSIVRLGRERMSGIGHEQYGDATWHRPLDVLKFETLEEIADAVVYQSAYRARVNGDIDQWNHSQQRQPSLNSKPSATIIGS